MKLHTFEPQKLKSDPYPPFVNIISVPNCQDFHTGKSNFTFEYQRRRSHRSYVFMCDGVTIKTGGYGGYQCGLHNANHGVAVKYLAYEADVRVLNQLHRLGLCSLVEAVGRHRARRRARAVPLD